MKFKYTGPHDAVDLDGHGSVERERGRVEATGAEAESLDAQSDWQRADRPKPRKPRKKAEPKPAPTTPPSGDKNEE